MAKTLDDKYKAYESSNTVQTALKRMETSREYVKPYFDRFIDNYKHYYLRIIDELVEEDEDNYPFYSQIMLPISYQIVETILPRMFNRMMTFTIDTEDQNDEKDEAALRELIKYQMNHPYLVDDPIFARLAGTAKEMFITGNAWGMVPWVKKTEKVKEWLPYSPELGLPPSWESLPVIDAFGIKPRWMLSDVDKTVIDAPVYEHKNIFHVFPDAKKKRVSDLGYAIVEEDLTMSEIMQIVNAKSEGFKNIEELKKMEAMKESGSGEDWTNYDEELAGIFGSSDFRYKDDSKGGNQFKVWYMLEKDRASIIINEKLCIYNGANPNGDAKLGLILMKDIPVPHELYAWGEIDPIKRIEDAMTDQFNMRNDAVLHDLLKMWKLDPTALVDGEEFVPEPGNVIQMKDMTGLEPLGTGTTSASAYREYQEWDKLVQNTSGVSDYATGSADPSMNKTLGGVQALQQAANARFSFKLQLFESMGLKSVGTLYVKRNMRFFDTPQPVNGDMGKMVITPEMVRRIQGNVHFNVDTGSTESVAMSTELEKWKAVTDLVRTNQPPFQNLTMESQDKIAKRMLYSLRVNDADDLIQRVNPNPNPAAGGTGQVNGNMGVDGVVTTPEQQANAGLQTQDTALIQA